MMIMGTARSMGIEVEGDSLASAFGCQLQCCRRQLLNPRSKVDLNHVKSFCHGKTIETIPSNGG